jgi:hypothetical protein
VGGIGSMKCAKNTFLGLIMFKRAKKEFSKNKFQTKKNKQYISLN